MDLRSQPEGTRRDLGRSLADGVFYSLMVGVGETYLPAFVLAAGLGQVLAGWVATVPMLAGALLQLSTPWGVRRLRSHRRWVVLCAVVQALAFLPLVASATAGAAPALLVFVLASIYWGAGLASGPAWNTWITTLVPAAVRTGYFALRTRLCQGAVLAALLAGGWLLEASERMGWTLGGFAVLFSLASVFRAISARFLARQSEPVPLPPDFRAIGLRQAYGHFRTGSYRRLFAYMLAVQAAVQIASPFFTPFMLVELGLPYSRYMTLVAAAYVAKVLALPFLGRLAHRLGAQRLIWIGGLGIVPAALPWVLSDSFGVLLGAQLAAGMFWAAYELASFLLFFEHIADDERTSVLTLFNVANAVTIAGGALLGGALLSTLGADRQAYVAIFALSTGLRALTPLLLRRLGAPGRVPIPAEPIGARTIAVRPSLGSIDRPILPTVPHVDPHVDPQGEPRAD